MSVHTKMTAIADEIRTLSGVTERIGLDAMATNLNAANVEVVSQTVLLEQALAAIEGKMAGGDVVEPVLQEKTVSSSTSTQIVVPDSGYNGLSKVTVNAISTATQATPSIIVSSSGLITASATQTEGYVAAGTKSATKQLTVQTAQTITPGTSNQTIDSGKYLTGVQTIKGDANLVSDNIKSGVSIFGVSGSYQGQGGDVTSTPTQEKTIDIIANGIIEVLPDDGYALSKVTANVNVAGGGNAVNTNVCTVKVIPAASTNHYIARETVSGGAISFAMSRSYTASAISMQVRCDSILYVMASNIKSAEAADGEVLKVVSGQGVAYKTPSTSGVTVNLTLGA